MKSFNEHINVKREELKEGDPFDDLTNLLWVGAAAGGLYGLKKGWDKWGVEKEKEIAAKEKEQTAAAKAKIAKSGMSGQKKKQALGKQSLGKKIGSDEVEKKKAAAKKRIAALKAKKAGKEEFQKFALHELISLTGENRIQLLEELVLEETMSLEESNELQAIMALDDEGIKAEINRKGQVVVKKKDLKKAEKALKKSFRKGGEPKLVGEHKGTEPHKHPHEDEELDEDDLTSYLEMKMSAAAKKKKAIWAKSSAGKASLKKSKIRAKKVASGSIKIDKAKGRAMAKARAKGGIRNEFVPRTAYEVVSEARSRIIEVADEHAATELYLFMQNERDLQRQKDSIIKNIVRKKKAEKYDHSKAPKLWSYWVDNGAKAYDKEYSSPGAKTFDKDTRQSVAIQFANEYNTEIDLGNYS